MASDELSIKLICGDEAAQIDVVFIHGLAGDAEQTWTAKDSSDQSGGLWPRWLCEDFGTIRSFALGYPASVFEKWAKKEMSLFERSKSVLQHVALVPRSGPATGAPVTY